MLADQRRRPPLGFAIAAIGFGIALWYGYDWYRLPVMTEAQVAQLVELNLAADVARGPAGAKPTAEQLAPIAAQIRQEITSELERARSQARTGCLAGLAAGVFGLLQIFLLRRP